MWHQTQKTDDSLQFDPQFSYELTFLDKKTLIAEPTSDLT